MEDAEADVLVRAVDARVQALGAGCDPARLFGVRMRDEAFVLVPFWSGMARAIPIALTPPDGCVAIALDTGGWAAPMDDGIGEMRPSLHPRRRRIRQTTLVYGDDGREVSVLRYEDGEPQVMRGCFGPVVDRLRTCWASRRVAL